MHINNICSRCESNNNIVNAARNGVGKCHVGSYTLFSCMSNELFRFNWFVFQPIKTKREKMHQIHSANLAISYDTDIIISAHDKFRVWNKNKWFLRSQNFYSGCTKIQHEAKMWCYQYLAANFSEIFMWTLMIIRSCQIIRDACKSNKFI